MKRTVHVTALQRSSGINIIVHVQLKLRDPIQRLCKADCLQPQVTRNNYRQYTGSSSRAVGGATGRVAGGLQHLCVVADHCSPDAPSSIDSAYACCTYIR